MRNHSAHTQHTVKRRKLAPHDIQDLLAFIGNIEWGQTDSAHKEHIPPLDHPLKPVYESFMIIKNDFDVLLGEKETADKWLRSSYKELELRVERRTAQLNSVNTALQEARTTAEEANLAKSRFLANMGHEIRTPLNAIIGFAQIMSRTTPGPDHQKHSRIILSESRRLLELINQVLDISKIEAGKMELHLSVFGITELLDELQCAFALQAGQKGLEFIIQKGDDLPQAVIGDLLKVRQVLVNLLGNAFKFTERGHVTLTVHRIQNPDMNASMKILFNVSDTGPGIQPDRIEKIFQRFEQVDYSLSRKAGGTGLGTSISKQLVTLMGGTVGVQSEYGSGSTFWAEIPFEETAEIPASSIEETLPAVSLHGKQILLVEDYQPNQQVAQLHLKATGATLTIASNGLDAVSFAQEQKFDCILMDVQMPVMDGLEATASIRGMPGPNAGIPIIGMTAFVYDTDRIKCFSAGMSEVLPKPVEWDLALVKIAAWIQNRSPWPRESPLPAPVAAAVVPEVKMAIHQALSATVVLDWDRYVARMRGNAGMARTILDGFMEQLPTTLAELATAQTAADRDTVTRLVHSVKGAALNICADPLAAAAKELEIYLREHQGGGEEERMNEFLKRCGELQNGVLNLPQKR